MPLKRYQALYPVLARLKEQALGKGLETNRVKDYIVGTLQKICDEKGLKWSK